MHWTGSGPSELAHLQADGSTFVRDEARRTQHRTFGYQDLYRHTDPETTMNYASPQLQEHAPGTARWERVDRTPAPIPSGIRLAESAGSVETDPVSH